MLSVDCSVFVCDFAVSVVTLSEGLIVFFFFFFSSRRRHTRLTCDWSSDVCSSDLPRKEGWSRLTAMESAHGRVAARPDRGVVDCRASRPTNAGRLRSGLPAPTSSNRLGPNVVEIGRAACRERREDAVGGVVVKKRK